jgi:hypothetical protein
LGIPDFCKGGPLPLSEIWKRKQKHIDAYDIVEAIRSYPRIPSTFDGSLPFGSDEGRIQVGETYFFQDDGVIGTVTTATMLEQDRKILIWLDTGHVLEKPATEEELRDYKEHPDAYFGIIRRAGRKISDPYDFVEWLVENYNETPRDRLLELCKGCDDFDALAKLDQRDLVLALCERWTASAIAQSKQARQRSNEAGGHRSRAGARAQSGRL